MKNVLAIVGRPNVGKSTLFNRLIGERTAIMDNVSGVTRDRHYGYSHWNGIPFSVIDTGGYVVGSDDIFEGQIRDQVTLAIEEASVILFMVDIDTGLLGMDEDFARILHRTDKPIFLVANKADNADRALNANEFYALGMGDVYAISSQSGSGTGDLLDEVVKHFEEEEEEVYEKSEIPRISLVGRPNVGKSSLLNTLLDEERSIVTNIAGTTRDAFDTEYNKFGKHFIITDTAGIRKKAKVKEDIEFYSVIRSIRSIENSDVCVVMLDAQLGLEAQDQNIIGLADRNRKGIVLLVNKWDLMEKETMTSKHIEDQIRKKMAPIDYFPVVFISVHEKQRVMSALDKILMVADNRKKRISTSKLNDVLLPEIERIPPPSHRGHYIKIKYITQLPTPSPTFAFFCNHPKYIKESYKRFLENKVREHFDFEGVPVRIIFKKK